MINADSTTGHVRFDGALTVRCIGAARAALLEALAAHTALSVDCSAVESADLSLVQLLLSARLSANQAGKPFTLAAPAAGALRAALEQGGFLPATGADPLWAGDA